MIKKKVIRFRGKGRKEDVATLNDKFVAVKGSGIARQLRRKRRKL